MIKGIEKYLWKEFKTEKDHTLSFFDFLKDFQKNNFFLQKDKCSGIFQSFAIFFSFYHFIIYV